MKTKNGNSPKKYGKVVLGAVIGNQSEIFMTPKNKQSKLKGDTTQAKRQSKRRQILNKIAKVVGFAGWSAYETAVINGMARLTQRAPDVCPSCAGEKKVIGEDGTIWVCGICGGTGKRR